MFIREYKSSDCKEIIELFYNTVHSINNKDYTKEELNAWTGTSIDLDKWDMSLSKHFALVAVYDDIIIGFGDIDETGYLDRLYVHKDYQHRGVASEICNRLEERINVGKIITAASITAKPFFLKRGYIVVREQKVLRNGVFLTNFLMEKR